MIAGSGLAFISPLMLLVHNNQAQIRKIRKQSRAGSYHNLSFPLSGPLILIPPFACGKAGMHDTDTGSKTPVKPHNRLIGQRNFRNQNNDLPSLLQHMGNHFHVNLCFPASSNAINQGRNSVPSVIAAAEILCNLPLLFIKKNFGLPDLYINHGTDHLPVSGFYLSLYRKHCF